MDILTDEESEEVLREKKMRDQAFHSLESRDVSTFVYKIESMLKPSFSQLVPVIMANLLA